MGLELGFITDEVSRNLEESVAWCNEQGISRFELREGSVARFPAFTKDEIGVVERIVRDGQRITAVSPGTFKTPVDKSDSVQDDLTNRLPAAIDLAVQFSCPMIITFGFIRYAGEPEENRLTVVKTLAAAAAKAADAGLVLAVENEPPFWADSMRETVALIEEIDNPAFRVNWDPANLHWGGKMPAYDDFVTVKPYIANVHVKDFTPDDTEVPWRPVGEGETPWAEILPWINKETSLQHITLETHIQPWMEMSEKTLAAVRLLLDGMDRQEEG